MLTITAAQFEILRSVTLDTFASRLAADLAAHGHPSWAHRGDLPGIVQRSVVWAWDYGLRTENELRTFAQLALHVGEHFHAYPVFHQVLTSDEDDKLAALNDIAEPRQWLEAEVFSRAIDRQAKEAAIGR